MKECIFCNRETSLILGLAVGMIGFDYSVCLDCVKSKKIRDLIDYAVKYSNEQEEVGHGK